MLKLIYLGGCTLLAAFYYGQRAPESMVPPFHAVEEADRIFLADLNVKEAAMRESTAEIDRELLAKLQASRPVPVAVAVAVSTPIPVRAAIPVIRAREVASAKGIRATGVREPTPATSVINVSRDEAGADGEPEVRRALPVASHRTSFVIYGGKVAVFPAPRPQ